MGVVMGPLGLRVSGPWLTAADLTCRRVGR